MKDSEKGGNTIKNPDLYREVKQFFPHGEIKRIANRYKIHRNKVQRYCMGQDAPEEIMNDIKGIITIVRELRNSEELKKAKNLHLQDMRRIGHGINRDWMTIKNYIHGRGNDIVVLRGIIDYVKIKGL